jgi:hypothetical protein
MKLELATTQIFTGLGKLSIFMGLLLTRGPDLWAFPAKTARQLSLAEDSACRVEAAQPSSPVLYAEDFRWGLLREDLLSLFEWTYQSPKRLMHHARIRGDMIVLPYEAERGGAVEVPLQVAEVIASHMEMAISRRFVDAVFFPDMGHSHFLIPDQVYEKEYADIPVKQYNQLYQKLLTDERVLILYHTAEQLAFMDGDQVKDEPYYQWRHKTRNLLASTKLGVPLRVVENPDSPANTVNEVAGYRWWGAGFQISAHHRGCFVYKHGSEERRFDISLYDLPSNQSFAD